MNHQMLGDIIMTIYKNLKTRTERDLRQYDLGMGQIQILMCFFDNVNAVRTQSDLVRQLGVDKGNVSRSIAKLLEKGYLEQAKDNKKNYKLTDNGIKLKAEVKPIFAQIGEIMAKGIGKAEVNQTVMILKEISKNLEEAI